MSKRAVTSFFGIKALINNKKAGGNGDGLIPLSIAGKDSTHLHLLPLAFLPNILSSTGGLRT